MRSHFIKATQAFNTFEQNVPAYYFKRAFEAEEGTVAKITIAVCGFYELYLNGKRITRGLLSPYISNTNDYIYYDEYDVTLEAGENVIGVWLGNGLQNNPGGFIWAFDQAEFRSAPMLSLTVESGGHELLHSDESFRIAPSPLLRDDYRFGEYYDANREIDGWNRPGFDDADWQAALSAVPPRGEFRLADVAPIVKEREIRPVSMTKIADGYIYDFGVSFTGVCRLCVKGEKGQRIELRHADSLVNGDLNLLQIWFLTDHWPRDKEIVHCDTYVCRGEGVEVYQPTFTYHGFRYVKVSGITDEQATEELLTYLVYHTELDTYGDFSCSDATVNQLQEMTRRSILSNFHHFPTDCPQREKNGWTADAALSSEAALINFNPERNYREWMKNIVKAQREDGALPGIVPTGGWGFDWGNGPAWDSVMAYLPYFTYLYRGETDMIHTVADPLIRYLRYLRSRFDENGLLAIGLGDWCQVDDNVNPKAPLIVTDSIVSMHIARMTAEMLEAIGRAEDACFARGEAQSYRAAIREHLIDSATLRVKGDCQTSQAMALYYGVFDEDERERAFEQLLMLIHDADDHIDLGVLGGRVIFHVLAAFGHADLAFRMITREDYPSFGNWIARGATTLWEDFYPDRVSSMNHHFWGDISAWFIKCIAGINLNPHHNNVSEVTVAPHFIATLTEAKGYHVAPAGKIAVSWKRDGEDILLNVEIPAGMSATLALEPAYTLEGRENGCAIVTGQYKVVKSR